ncbi:1-deoxy-D-xylulose-5-phosphate synthase [uncultured archaeon]|nr:1-deoxy-D-xylulose-5-phosphate synthase [uncultured archaeon]
MTEELTFDEYASTRNAYGETLVALGSERQDIIVLDADLSSSTQTKLFSTRFPERFFNVGVAEQNLIDISAGIALSGKTVFASTFAMFGTGRGWEMIRNTLAYDQLNVKLVFTHSGLLVGQDGSCHQSLEDIAIMRAIPGLTVMIPADANETKAMIRYAAETPGPFYIRLSREKTPVLFKEYHHKPSQPFVIEDGEDVTICATGVMVAMALQARCRLSKEGVSARVINMNQIKPLDADFIVKNAKETGAIVTAEEHSIIGGIGSAIAETLAERHPTPMRRIGTQDKFGESGLGFELLEKYGLTASAIANAAKELVKQK